MNYLRKSKQLNKLREKYKIEFSTYKREWKLNALKAMIYKLDSELKEYDKLVPKKFDSRVGNYNPDYEVKA